MTAPPPQVGIVTLQTPREVAAEAGLPPGSVPNGDARVGAVVVTGAQVRELASEEAWDEILCKVRARGGGGYICG